LDIHEDAHVIAYLHIGEVLVRLTPKKWDRIVHKAKWFRWEGNNLLRVWTNGWVWVVPHPKQHEGLIQHVHEKLGRFGIRHTHSLF
jgi:hypothetical protein